MLSQRIKSSIAMLAIFIFTYFVLDSIFFEFLVLFVGGFLLFELSKILKLEGINAWFYWILAATPIITHFLLSLSFSFALFNSFLGPYAPFLRHQIFEPYILILIPFSLVFWFLIVPFDLFYKKISSNPLKLDGKAGESLNLYSVANAIANGYEYSENPKGEMTVPEHDGAGGLDLGEHASIDLWLISNFGPKAIEAKIEHAKYTILNKRSSSIKEIAVINAAKEKLQGNQSEPMIIKFTNNTGADYTFTANHINYQHEYLHNGEGSTSTTGISFSMENYAEFDGKYAYHVDDQASNGIVTKNMVISQGEHILKIWGNMHYYSSVAGSQIADSMTDWQTEIVQYGDHGHSAIGGINHGNALDIKSETGESHPDCKFRYFVNERIGTILLSALLAHSAWHWMLERGTTLSLYQIQMPVFDSLFWAALMRWGMMFIIIAVALWAMYELFRKFSLIDSFSIFAHQNNVKNKS